MKISVIGIGHLGMIHARLVKQRTDIELIGISDASPERSAYVSKELDIPIHDSMDSAIAQSDAVIISASTKAHHEIAKKSDSIR